MSITFCDIFLFTFIALCDRILIGKEVNKLKEFKNIIYSLRAAKGLSQKDLSKELGVGQSTVAMWESGQRIPSVQMYEQLADYFNVDLDYLHGRTDIVRKTMFDEFGNNYFPSDKKLQYLNKYYSQLNDIGKDEAVKRVRELTYIPEFKNVQLIAAHERTDIEITDEMIKYDDELVNYPSPKGNGLVTAQS